MEHVSNVAIFWDYGQLSHFYPIHDSTTHFSENCPPSPTVDGCEIVGNIRSLAHSFGSVVQFKAYLPFATSPASTIHSNLKSELQASGVSLTHCPTDSGNSLTEKMMLVDMIAYAIDHPAPATVLVISASPDFAYAISTLRLRKYRVVLVCPSSVHSSLIMQASVHLDWNTEVLGKNPPDSVETGQVPRMSPFTRHNSRRGSSPLPPPAISGEAQIMKDDSDEEEDSLYFSRRLSDGFRHSGGSSLSRHPPDNLFRRPSSTGPTWRAVQKPYSPLTPFRSVKTSLPTVPPLGDTSAEPSAFSRHNSSSDDSQKSRPNMLNGSFHREPEHIMLKPVSESVEPEGKRRPPQASFAAIQQPEVQSTPNFEPQGTSPLAVTPPPTGSIAPTAASASSTKLVVDAAVSPIKFPSAKNFPATVPPPIPPVNPMVPAATSSTSAVNMLPAPGPPKTIHVPKPVQSDYSDTQPIPPTLKLSQPTTPGSIPAKPTNPPTSVASAATQREGNRIIPATFIVLVDVLEARRRSKGEIRVSRSDLGTDLAKHKNLYQLAGVSRFASYIDLAQEKGIVDASSSWVMLRPEWSVLP